MVSTITISTIIAGTTVSTTAGVGVIIGAVAVVALAIFLFVKELATASNRSTHQHLSHGLDVVIIPLSIAFAVILVMQILNYIA